MYVASFQTPNPFAHFMQHKTRPSYPSSDLDRSSNSVNFRLLFTNRTPLSVVGTVLSNMREHLSIFRARWRTDRTGLLSLSLMGFSSRHGHVLLHWGYEIFGTRVWSW